MDRGAGQIRMLSIFSHLFIEYLQGEVKSGTILRIGFSNLEDYNEIAF